MTVAPLILLVEPDPARARELTALLLQAGYEALAAMDAAHALRRLFMAQPAAVLLSDRLSVAEVQYLSERIAALTDLPLLALTEGEDLAAIAQRLSGATGSAALCATLDDLLRKRG